DNKDSRGLQRCVDQLARLAERGFEPERPRRLHQIASALNALHNKVNTEALATAAHFIGQVRDPVFDVETACNLITLMTRMVAQGLTPPDADAAIHAIALRFGTSRAMSELLGCAAREHEAWSQTLRQGHAQVLRVSE